MIIQLNYLFRNSGEYFRTVGGEFGEDLTIECKTVFLQFRDKCGVGLMPVVADGGVQANDPELAEVGLLVAAVVERVLAGVHERLVRLADLRATAMTEALRALQYVCAALRRRDSSFYACHTELIT